MQNPVLMLAALVLLGLGALAAHGVRALGEARATADRLAPGPVDIGFAQAMSRHHQQAIALSQLMLDGRPSALAALARRIASSQLVELGEMQGWLRLWEQPLQRASRDMDWMLLGKALPDAELSRYLLDCQRSPTGMPGLAPDSELARLRSLDGITRDRHFLTLMLAHHEGALPMAGFAAREARLGAVRELAARVVLDQSEEIGQMRRMLQVLASVADGQQ